MTYRDKFISKIRKSLEAETVAYRRMEKAEDFLNDYFGELTDDLFEESMADPEQFEIDYYLVRYHDIELSIEFSSDTVDVFLKNEPEGEKNIFDRLTVDGYSYKSQKYGLELSAELMDQYLKTAFEKIL
ncbi:MAG: hypothetical protein SVV67_09075 [Bacillota bacterium]|nr:hypothetical protein [Bacillota bacterium]